MFDFAFDHAHFFHITFGTLNLFSFVLGVAWAMTNQSLGQLRYNLWFVVWYFVILAVYLGLIHYGGFPESISFAPKELPVCK